MRKSHLLVVAGLMATAGCGAGTPPPATGGEARAAAGGSSIDMPFAEAPHDRVITLEPGAVASCAPRRTLVAGERSGHDHRPAGPLLALRLPSLPLQP